MNKKLVLLGGMIVASCMMSPRSFAQDYQQVNVFNRFTDWTVTLGKSPDVRQHIIDQRIDMRAKDREAWDHKRAEEQKINSQRDEEAKSYENRKNDLRNQYRNDQDTLNKKLQDAENDHNAKMNDFDNQWKSAEGK